MDPELECFDAQTRKSEGFGELKGGFLVRCSLGMCRLYVGVLVAGYPYLMLDDTSSIALKISSSRLLDPKHFLLPLLGSMFPLETAVGMNGRVWVNCKSPKHTIAVARCIEAADPDGGSMTEDEIKKFVGTLDL